MKKYISIKNIGNYLNGKSYTSIHKTGSVTGMKRYYGWDKAKEIVYSGQYIYTLYGINKLRKINKYIKAINYDGK